MNVQISKIKPSPLNESVYGKITDGDVADLIESIRDLEGDWPGVLPEHYKDLGIYFAEQNLAQDAINAFQRGLQLDPQNDNIRIVLGWIIHQRGHLDKAIEKYNYTLGRGIHRVAKFNLALAYLQKGMAQEAHLQYAQAIEH